MSQSNHRSDPSTLPDPGYEWTALSVTTLGALLAAMQGTALLIALPDILVKMKIFLYGGGMGSDPTAVSSFLEGLHEAFWVSAGLPLLAAAASAFQPSHSPRTAAGHPTEQYQPHQRTGPFRGRARDG